MAQPIPERDPIAEELAQVLADNPGLLEELKEDDRKRRLGELKTVPHEEVLRRLGLDRPSR